LQREQRGSRILLSNTRGKTHEARQLPNLYRDVIFFGEKG